METHTFAYIKCREPAIAAFEKVGKGGRHIVVMGDSEIHFETLDDLIGFRDTLSEHIASHPNNGEG